MSPEQARGLRNIDQRTDLWSLGVIAFKCVTGNLPFDGESVGDLLVKICTATPPPPSHTMPGLPASFDSWFARALEREPERRFQSASELADALAMATGLSQRRAVSQNGFPPYSSPSSHGQPQPMSGGILAGAVTSSPFTASASVSKPSRGVVFGAVLAAVIGASVGVVAVVKFVSSSNGGTTSAATSAGPSDPGLGASAPHPGPLANNQVVLALSSSPAAPPSATLAASSVPAPPPPPPAPAPVHTASKPSYSPPKPVPPAAPVASAAKPPPSTSPAPPPPPPSKPVQADPGY
jgi:serine/threonine-protein kinase